MHYIKTLQKSGLFFVGAALVFSWMLVPKAPVMAYAAPSVKDASQYVTTNASNNWAGYAETGGTFTGVTGTWTIPTVTSTAGEPETSDATWVGIGGADTQDLIQVGTQAVVQNGEVAYEPWYEILPATSVQIPMTVNVGDSISASISETSQNQWTISFRDNTIGQSYSTMVTYQSSLTSAEWIEEMPSTVNGKVIPLDNFGTVTFQNALAIKNGNQGNLVTNDAQSVTMMTTSDQVLATASSINTDGESFSVTRDSDTAATSSDASVPVRVPFGQGGVPHAGRGMQGIPGQTTEFQEYSQPFTIQVGGNGIMIHRSRFGRRR